MICLKAGIAVALAESCISGNLGAQVALDTSLRSDVALFSESQSRVILSVAPEQVDALQSKLTEAGVPNVVLGTVGGETLSIKVNGQSKVDAPVSELKQVWKDAIPCYMEK